MALFWFLCGMLLILGIARYNESNKLFWILLVSFIGAFTATSIVESILDNKKEENVMVNASPTQLYTSTYDLLSPVTNDALCTTNGTNNIVPVTVSKDYYIDQHVSSAICSRVNNPLDKPPQIQLRCLSISTLPKTRTFIFLNYFKTVINKLKHYQNGKQ